MRPTILTAIASVVAIVVLFIIAVEVLTKGLEEVQSETTKYFVEEVYEDVTFGNMSQEQGCYKLERMEVTEEDLDGNERLIEFLNGCE